VAISAAGVMLLAACGRPPEPSAAAANQTSEAEAPPVVLAGGPPPSTSPAETAAPAETGEDQPPAPVEPAPAPASDAANAEPATAVISDRDPLALVNRRLYAIDRRVTHVIDAPLEHLDAKPKSRPVVTAVRNVFTNLDEPATAMNDILQRKPRRAVQAAARFVVNSTAGMAGLFDVADRIGLHKSKQDFGRTLGSYGVKPGPFVYIPLIGPTNPRDFFAGMVDAVVSPTRWLHLPVWEHQARSVVVRQLRRKELHRAEADVRTAAAVPASDDYEVMRRAAVQRRAKQVADVRSKP
jgi:phospholipid-binding lipoprotein MlaA